jgi:hypothetical protein
MRMGIHLTQQQPSSRSWWLCYAFLDLYVLSVQSQDYEADIRKSDIWSCVGTMFVTASLAEMSSM